MDQQVVTTEVTQQPPADPDAVKWEGLRKELGIEPEGAGEEAGAGPSAEPKEPAAEPKEPPQPDHVPRTEHENLSKALAAEREQRRAAEAREQAILRLVQEARQRPQQQPESKKDAPKIPDVNEDPIGHFKAVNEQLQAKIEAIERGSGQTAEQLQTQVQHQQLLQLVQHSEAAILDAKNPEAKADYWDACAYLEGQRDRELQRMYPDNNPYVQQYAMSQGFQSAAQLRESVLNRDRWAVAVQALQMGISPAEFYYSLAQDRGYQPKANGKAPNGLDKAKQQIAATKKGRAASVSISGDAGGAKATDELSVSDLAEMYTEAQAAGDEKELARLDAIFDRMGKLGKLG